MGSVALCLADSATDLPGEQHAVYVLGVWAVPWGWGKKRGSQHTVLR